MGLHFCQGTGLFLEELFPSAFGLRPFWYVSVIASL